MNGKRNPSVYEQRLAVGKGPTPTQIHVHGLAVAAGAVLLRVEHPSITAGLDLPAVDARAVGQALIDAANAVDAATLRAGE